MWFDIQLRLEPTIFMFKLMELLLEEVHADCGSKHELLGYLGESPESENYE
jgi:hypothetical protein